MDKLEAHRGDGKLHRAISVFLFRKTEAGDVELLIQQRSDKKIVGAGQWANTVCGNVWPEESYESCARRRLEFELGISGEDQKLLELAPVTKFRYQVKCNEEFSENEIDQVFMGWFDGEIKLRPNFDEVAGTRWVEWSKLSNISLREALEINWAPWIEIMFQNEVSKLLTKNIDDRK